MLKRWTVSPLYDADQINKRLDAVEELALNKSLRVSIQKRLNGLTDVERILTKIYTYSVKQKVKAFWVDAQALNRLNEFYDLLELMNELLVMLKDLFGKGKHKPKSMRLKQLVGIKKIVIKDADVDMQSQSEDEDDHIDGGIFPDYGPLLEEFNDMVVWKSAGNKKIPEPKHGIDDEFDQKNERIENLRA